jgi:class 3 adenylate cyclase
VRSVEQGEGDSVVVAFEHASHAVECALELQRGLAAAKWPDGSELRVRVSLHSGEAVVRDPGNYVGSALNRCARLRAVAGADVLLKTEMSAGHGGVSGRYESWRERAYELAWVIDTLGAPEQPVSSVG